MVFDGRPYGLERAERAGEWWVTEHGQVIGSVRRIASTTGRSVTWQPRTADTRIGQRNYPTRNRAAQAVLAQHQHPSRAGPPASTPDQADHRPDTTHVGYGLVRTDQAGVWAVLVDGTRVGTVRRERSLSGRSTRWQAWMQTPYMRLHGRRTWPTRTQAAVQVLAQQPRRDG